MYQWPGNVVIHRTIPLNKNKKHISSLLRPSANRHAIYSRKKKTNKKKIASTNNVPTRHSVGFCASPTLGGKEV
jgi:hypothetical protein